MSPQLGRFIHTAYQIGKDIEQGPRKSMRSSAGEYTTDEEGNAKKNWPGMPDGQPTKEKQERLWVVMYLQNPFIMKRYNASQPQGIEYYGYCIDLLRLVRDKMKNGSDPWFWDYDLYEGNKVKVARGVVC